MSVQVMVDLDVDVNGLYVFLYYETVTANILKTNLSYLQMNPEIIFHVVFCGNTAINLEFPSHSNSTNFRCSVSLGKSLSN